MRAHAFSLELCEDVFFGMVTGRKKDTRTLVHNFGALHIVQCVLWRVLLYAFAGAMQPERLLKGKRA